MKDQPAETKTIMAYPTIEMTEGQNSAFEYLFANTKSGIRELHQLIFDAGLVQLFQAATLMHGEYLADVATATKEGDNGDNRP